MNRDPSIHITKSQFELEFSKLLTKYNIKTRYTKLLVNDLMLACRRHACTNRTVNVTNQKLLKKTDKIGKSGIGNTQVFAQLLTLQRRQLKHRGITIPLPGSDEWLQLKELTALADEFCGEYQLNQKEGYKEYIDIALSKMQKYGLNKIKSLHTSVFTTYEAREIIRHDKYPGQSEEAYNIYSSIIAEKTGISDLGYREWPEKYSVFVNIAQESRRLNVAPATYIRAQFEAFGWKEGVPDPLQMVGHKAISRVQKYCFEHSINTKAKPEVKVDWKKIKKV